MLNRHVLGTMQEGRNLPAFLLKGINRPAPSIRTCGAFH